MAEHTLARGLIENGKYKEAAHVLDILLGKDRDDPDLWFLKGLVALKLRNYQIAKDHLVHAIALRDKPEYRKMMGIVHFEMFEIEDAVDEFLHGKQDKKLDAETHMYLAICFMLLDDPRSSKHLKEALKLDPEGNSRSLDQFFHGFIEKDPRVEPAQKERILGMITRLKDKTNGA
jgi:tetratricopeptide (TPR) repeat protein